MCADLHLNITNLNTATIEKVDLGHSPPQRLYWFKIVLVG